MSESSGTAWPPSSGDLDESADSDESPDEDSEESETPDRYTPDHLGSYKVVSIEDGDWFQVNIGTPALKRLFVEPGDRIEVHEHPHGLLLVPSNERVDVESGPVEPDPEDEAALPRGITDGPEAESDDWTSVTTSISRDPGPIPPEVPWSEMVRYQCQNYWCSEYCINHVEEECTQKRVCRGCHEFDKAEL